MGEATQGAGGARRFGPLATTDGRLRFLDLARGVAIVLMVFQHTQLLFAAGSGERSPLGLAFLLLGTAPAAPVFMVAMGFLFGASSRSGVRSWLVRGLKLVALGYALNLLRFTLPLLIAGSPALEAPLSSPWTALLEVDILQLAGLSLLVLGPVKRWVRAPWAVVALAASVILVAPLLWGSRQGAAVFDPLWGTGANVSFPLFPWLAYPLLGLALAAFATRATAAGRLMARWALAGGLCLVAGAGLLGLFPGAGGVLAAGDYFRSGVPVQLMLAGFALVWLPALWWLDGRLRGTLAPRYLTSLSVHITPIYVIQWVLIGWLTIVGGVHGLPSWVAALLAVPVLATSHLLALSFAHVRAAMRRRSRGGQPAGAQ
jgi:surface polysaccharide O-acyltransferase-like enzyme